MHKLIKITAAIFVFALFFHGTPSAHAQMAPVAIPGQNYPIQVQDAAANNTYGQTVTNPLTAVTDAVTGAGGTLVDWISTKAVNKVLFYASYWVGTAGSTLFTLAGLLVEFGLFLNTTILDSQVVQLGWRFCRDLANLGFTIGIVVIAYATMLGIESYGMKTLIKNFIVAAVMVNFSFSIAGAMIDGSNLLTNFFVSAAIGGGPTGSADNIKKFGDTLAGTFGPQRLLVTDNSDDLEKFRESSGGMWAATLSVFFVALLTIFCALGMLSVGLTMFWRFTQLSGLVIIMPLAVLASSFPDTKKHWGKWKGKFLCQLTHIPTLTFFLYLVIMFVQIKASAGLAAGDISATDILNSFEKSNLAGGGTSSTLALMAKPFQVITDMAIVLAMVFMSIIEARKVGCAAGDSAIDWMNGVKKWAIGTVQGAPGWAGRKYLSGGTGGAGPEENRGTRLGNLLQRIPLVSRLVPRLNSFAAGTKKNLGNFEGEYKGLGDTQLRNALYNPDIKIDSERMAAAAKEAAARGLLNEKDPAKNVSQEKFAEFIPALKRYGFDKDILKKAPHLYGKFGLDLSKGEDKKKFEAAMKDFKPEDMTSLPVEAFADPEIVSRFTSAHLEKLPKEEKSREAFAKTFNSLRDSLGDEKFSQLVTKAFAKPEADAALLPALLRNPLVVKNLTNANLKKLADSDKAEHRRALLETINDTSKLSDKELADFMRTNFSKGTSIDEIHPDIIRNKRFFAELDERHIARKNIEPDESQQEAMIAGLRESYKYLNEKAYTENETPKAEALAKLDRMAKVIVDKKKDWQWSPLVENEKIRESFTQVESNYRSRNPDEALQKEAPKQKKGRSDDIDPYGPPTPTPPSKGPNSPTGTDIPNTQPTPTPRKINPEPTEGTKPFDIGRAMDNALSSLQSDEIIEKTATQKEQEKQKQAPDQVQLNELQSARASILSTPTQAPELSAFAQPEIKAQARPPAIAKDNEPAIDAYQKPRNETATKTPLLTELSGNFPKSLEATAIPKLITTTPSELDALTRSKESGIRSERVSIANTTPNLASQGRGWQPPEPIDATFEPKNNPAIGFTEQSVKRIEYKGSLVPPTQSSLPKLPRAEDNQLSVIPKSEIAKINPPEEQTERKNTI